MKIGMVSLGCPKNWTDAEIMLGILAEKGHEIVASPELAEVIIVNTCGFIDPAKQESIDTILEMAEYKNSGECKLLIATGCLAERYHDNIKKELPEVDAIVGAGEYERIDEGCDNNCTYCAIPMIRGHFRSRQIEDIVQEAKELVKSGVRELIVIAQDTTRYGLDIYGKPSLDKLLLRLAEIESIHWIRVHYFYTEAITEALIDVMAKSSKICNYIDMPILRRMARRTSRAEIEDKISLMRKKIPDVSIRTSIIAGFPGETEEQFSELYEFLKEVELDRVGVFAYSAEEDTPAAKFDGQLDDSIKNERRDKLMELQQGISLKKNKAKIGTRLEVLCEGYDADNFLYYGRSYADSIEVDGQVYFAAEDEVLPGEFVTVEILDADEYDLTGKQI